MREFWTPEEIARLEPHLEERVDHEMLHQLIPSRTTGAIRCQLAKMRAERGINPRSFNPPIALSTDRSYEKMVKKGTSELAAKFQASWEATRDHYLGQRAA